ncbi:recombination protein F [Phycisphaerae bacterium RAS1]|nr:recombination protein F [Phycisphaerae bacterium RAS1]
MPRFPDAIGYLIEMRDAVGEAWFHALCDFAIAASGESPRPEALDDLWSLFHGDTQYVPAAATIPATPAATAAVPPPAYLEHLTDFNAFKKLVPGLAVRFDRQLTVIFGKNGSGKSSLCQALKVLANPDRPADPLHNVRATYPGTPTFAYQFRGQAAPAMWNQTFGFGTLAPLLKYFDSTVAIKHITGTLQPRAVVEVAPFRLEVFEYARVLLTAFQAAATNRINDAASRLQADIDASKQRLAGTVNINAAPFDQWTATNSASCAEYFAGLPAFDDTKAARLGECTRALGQLTAASSEEGLRSLRAQHALLVQFASQLTSLSEWCNSARLADLQATETQASQKRTASAELARLAFPAGANHEQHHALIAAAAAMYDLSAFRAGEHVCPLCNQGITDQAQRLFIAYQGYLTSNLQTELAGLDRTLQTGRATLDRVAAFRLNDYSACRDLLPPGTYDVIVALSQAIAGSVPTDGQPLSTGNATQYARASELAGYIESIRAAQTAINEAITTGTQNRQELTGRINAVQVEIGGLRVHQAIASEKNALVALCDRSTRLTPEHQRINRYDFASRLRAMTNKGKDAHRELVLGTFEQRLSDEYRSLCGATLDQMGVRLSSRGDQQDIIVTPQVGESPVHRVLSEGEQKVHALAVFMCEAATAPHRVLVFDDPATSFDYNYVSNFCERLRNLVRDQPATQVIVLTHNWDFFVNLQATINRSPGLNARMSVQVLEDCATVREYSENWDELCNEITPLLAGPAEPSAEGKERAAGLMRRLIERLTNKHVFNEQRHQYKAKTLQVSEFHAFTKVVPLEPAEADTLRDIFANLSPPEHDDPRNFYTTRSRAQFNTWLGQIHAIKAALEARRP